MDDLNRILDQMAEGIFREPATWHSSQIVYAERGPVKPPPRLVALTCPACTAPVQSGARGCLYCGVGLERR